MRSSFVELVVKNRLAGKSVPLGNVQKKYQPVDSFKQYMTSVLPKIEQTVEIQLLKRNLSKLESPLMRKELVSAYLRRLYRLRFYEEEEIKSYKQPPDISAEEEITFVDPTTLKTIEEHTYYDVGSYIMFSNQDFQTVFPSKPFGPFQNEYEVSEKFAMMVRKESIGLANAMRALQEAAPVDWPALMALPPEERLEFVDDEKNYPALFQELSNYIYAKARQLRDSEKYLRVWGSSVISDTLVNSILQSIDQLDDVFAMADQAFDCVMAQEVEPSASDFTKRFKELDTSPPLPIRKHMPYSARFNYDTPSCKSVFLGGLAGTGRSMILAYAAMFAFKHNWVVVSVPNVLKWTQDEKAEPKKMFNGLFVNDQQAAEWLEEFRTTNEHLLKDMSVNLSIYGRMDLTGTREDEYEPVPNIYYKDRQTHFEDITKRYQERVEVEFDTRPKWRMTDVAKEPKSVLDILKAGVANPEYATCAMGEVLQQVYESDRLVLEVVDDFSWLYRRTAHRFYKYFNDRDLFGAIPPYHLAHCRFFVNLDGHKIRRGLKVVASSVGSLYKHHFDIKKIMLPEEYEHRVPNLTPQEFLRAARYNILTGYWQADEIQRKNPLYMYTLSQGNWLDFIRAAELGHYY